MSLVLSRDLSSDLQRLEVFLSKQVMAKIKGLRDENETLRRAAIDNRETVRQNRIAGRRKVRK